MVDSNLIDPIDFVGCNITLPLAKILKPFFQAQNNGLRKTAVKNTILRKAQIKT